MKFHNGVTYWGLTFIRSIQDWELESLTVFMDLLYAMSRQGSREDSILWGLGKGKCFIVSSYYRALSGTVSGSFPWKLFWKSRVLPRVAFFVWTVALGKFLTTDNLRRRQMVAVGLCSVQE